MSKHSRLTKLSADCCLIASLAALSGSGYALWAQQVPEVRVSGGSYRPTPTYSAQSNLVPALVVVRDESGDTIKGLTRDQFRVLDDGRPRPISSFQPVYGPPSASPPSPGDAVPPQTGAAAQLGPRVIALFFDDVLTDQNDLANARNAAGRFANEGLAPGERMAIFTASSTVGEGLTSDRQRLAAAIAEIGPHPRFSTGVTPCPHITAYEAYLVSQRHDPVARKAVMSEAAACEKQTYSATLPPEYVMAQADATWDQARALALDNLGALSDAVDYLRRAPGKRILIVVSGGFLSGTTENLQDTIIRDALHANVTISSLDAKGLDAEDLVQPLVDPSVPGILPIETYAFKETSILAERGEEDAAMANLAQATGGLFFHNSNDLGSGFRRLGLAPAVSYEIAFAPPAMPADGKLHKLRFELRPPVRGATMEARRGYFDPPPPDAAARLQTALDAAVRGPEPGAASGAASATATQQGVRAQLGVRTSGLQIRAELRLDVRRLPFADEQGRRVQKLIMIAALFAANGDFAAGNRGEMDLALKPATWERYCTQGLGADLTLAAPGPGTYRLRVVIGEQGHGAVSAYSSSVTVPQL